MSATVKVSQEDIRVGGSERGRAATNKDGEQNWGEEVQRKEPQPLWWPP